MKQIKKEGWIPGEGECYWAATSYTAKHNIMGDNTSYDDSNKKYGNLFKTKKDALKIVDEFVNLCMNFY